MVNIPLLSDCTSPVMMLPSVSSISRTSPAEAIRIERENSNNQTRVIRRMFVSGNDRRSISKGDYANLPVLSSPKEGERGQMEYLTNGRFFSFHEAAGRL